jgi:uracil-DNA glycosylase
LGIEPATFYDMEKIAIVPMAFCFPGYNSKGGDLPPPPICAKTWRAQVLAEIGPVRLTILVGNYAIRWHLKTRQGMTETVAQWRHHAPILFPLPHPSWRNTAWLRKNRWFETDVLPALQTRVREVLRDG